MLQKQQHNGGLKVFKANEYDGVLKNNEVDLYRYGQEYKLIELEHAGDLTQKLMAGFKYSLEQCGLMISLMINEGWTLQRFEDAYNDLLSKNLYNVTGTGHILGYQKTAKFYTYREILSKVDKGECEFNEYEAVKIEGINNFNDKGKEIPYWALKRSNPFKKWDMYLKEKK